MLRTIRAFTKALQMTLRGETVPARPYARLYTWIEEAERRISAVYAAAEDAGFDIARRKAISLKIDGRTTNANTIIDTIAYHLREEYPYLLKHVNAHSITAIYASNANDQYAVARLSEHEALRESPLAAPLVKLRAHLDAIPPSNTLNEPSANAD